MNRLICDFANQIGTLLLQQYIYLKTILSIKKRTSSGILKPEPSCACPSAPYALKIYINL